MGSVRRYWMWPPSFALEKEIGLMIEATKEESDASVATVFWFILVVARSTLTPIKLHDFLDVLPFFDGKGLVRCNAKDRVVLCSSSQKAKPNDTSIGNAETTEPTN